MQNGLMAEPTYRMNEDILRPQLEDIMRELHVPFVWKASDDLYTTPYGKIILRTQDKRSALEGHNIGWFGLDEMDLLPKEKNLDNWKTLISKLTKGTKQYGFGVGTNEGFEFIYEKFYKGAAKIDENVYQKSDEFKLFIASTLENERNLPEGYIQSLYDNYDERLISRYINGEFVNIKSGRVYNNFTEANKVSCKFDPSRPLIMSWDVNYSDRPMSTTILQLFRASEVFKDVPPNAPQDIIVAVNGFYNTNTNTETQCQIIAKWLNENNFNNEISIYGDRTGHDRRVGAAKSHYKIVEEYFGEYITENVKTRATRSIIDRVTSVNTLFCNSKGERRLFIDQDIEELIADLEQTVWKDNKNELDGSNNRTDATDSLSYYCYYEHDITKIYTRVL